MSMEKVKATVDQEALNCWNKLEKLKHAYDSYAAQIQACITTLEANSVYKDNAVAADKKLVSNYKSRTSYVND